MLAQILLSALCKTWEVSAYQNKQARSSSKPYSRAFNYSATRVDILRADEKGGQKVVLGIRDALSASICTGLLYLVRISYISLSIFLEHRASLWLFEVDV